MRKTGNHDWRRFDALADAEVHKAALEDPDAQPLTDEALAGMKPVPRARTLRRALGLTQEEFAERYHIPIGTLRDWEQARTEPDQPARAYLTAIAHDPEGVRAAVEHRWDVSPQREGVAATSTLETALHRLIPNEVRTFAKLEHGDPYHFDRWANDNADTLCLYYWFMARDGVKKNKKRVPVSEIRAALRQLLEGRVKRETFRKICPVTEAAGPCGFAVVGRIFVELGIAVYSGRRDGFKLSDANKARKLLDG